MLSKSERMNMNFATLLDVARSAGVSYATVDRVVNDRGGVAQKTIVRVQDAIQKLGYERDETAANLARKRVYRFHFLLPDDSNDFFSALNTALQFHQTQSNLLRTRFQTTRVPTFSEAAIVNALDGIDSMTTDCVCIVAFDTPNVIAAILRAKARGLKIVTLVSDITATERNHYVGIDNLVAGKTAGRMMGLAHTQRSGCVLPIIGANRALDHTQRLQGFCNLIQTYFPAIRLLEPVKSYDEALTIHRVLSDAWIAHPDLTGVYNIGAGNDGLIEWVSGITPMTRPIMIIHELLPTSRTALEAGLIDAVIDQKPNEAIGEALRIMRLMVDVQPLVQDTHLITPAIYLCENLPTVSTKNSSHLKIG
ncbi:MAG: LacI family transcriptional regulator [Alteromonas macleodii]|jgi:LacI family transcriptional regulator